MGLILAANGVGAAVATQIVTPIIYAPGDAFGYRNAYKLVALILAVTAGIVLALYREPPEKIPESTSAEKEPQQAESGQSTARGARFYLLLVCVFLTGFILQSTTGVSAAHMKDVGLDAGYGCRGRERACAQPDRVQIPDGRHSRPCGTSEDRASV